MSSEQKGDIEGGGIVVDESNKDWFEFHDMKENEWPDNIRDDLKEVSNKFLDRLGSDKNKDACTAAIGVLVVNINGCRNNGEKIFISTSKMGVTHAAIEPGDDFSTSDWWSSVCGEALQAQYPEQKCPYIIAPRTGYRTYIERMRDSQPLGEEGEIPIIIRRIEEYRNQLHQGFHSKITDLEGAYKRQLENNRKNEITRKIEVFKKEKMNRSAEFGTLVKNERARLKKESDDARVKESDDARVKEYTNQLKQDFQQGKGVMDAWLRDLVSKKQGIKINAMDATVEQKDAASMLVLEWHRDLWNEELKPVIGRNNAMSKLLEYLCHLSSKGVIGDSFCSGILCIYKQMKSGKLANKLAESLLSKLVKAAKKPFRGLLCNLKIHLGIPKKNQGTKTKNQGTKKMNQGTKKMNQGTKNKKKSKAGDCYIEQMKRCLEKNYSYNKSPSQQKSLCDLLTHLYMLSLKGMTDGTFHARILDLHQKMWSDSPPSKEEANWTLEEVVSKHEKILRVYENDRLVHDLGNPLQMYLGIVDRPSGASLLEYMGRCAEDNALEQVYLTYKDVDISDCSVDVTWYVRHVKDPKPIDLCDVCKISFEENLRKIFESIRSKGNAADSTATQE